jgi:hypothetical protein
MEGGVNLRLTRYGMVEGVGAVIELARPSRKGFAWRKRRVRAVLDSKGRVASGHDSGLRL